MSHAPYGYKLGTDEKRTLLVNDETAPIVKRIFEMRASVFAVIVYALIALAAVWLIISPCISDGKLDMKGEE